MSELGRFLRVRREETAPESVGLPAGTRRRTPGLRRAEVATLAGVSVEYLTRLEQGRDRNPSAQVLGALADVLRLSTDERVHLRFLAKAGTGVLCANEASPALRVRPTVRALLDHLDPAPAVVLNRTGYLLATTRAYERLMRPTGLLDGEWPNVIRHTLSDPRARDTCPDWEEAAAEQIAHLKSEVRRGDRHALELVDDLTVIAGKPFTERWDRQAGPPTRTGVRRLDHPTAGVLRLAYETLDLPDPDEQRLIVHLPADAETATALARLDRELVGARGHAAP